MNTMIESVATSILASIIFEFGKNLFNKINPEKEGNYFSLEETKKFVTEKLEAKYKSLIISGIFETYYRHGPCGPC